MGEVDWKKTWEQALKERDKARAVARDARQLLVEFEEDERVNAWFAVNDTLHPWLEEEISGGDRGLAGAGDAAGDEDSGAGGGAE